MIVEIYYYAGKVPFNELTIDEQRTLFAYAMEYVTKRGVGRCVLTGTINESNAVKGRLQPRRA